MYNYWLKTYLKEFGELTSFEGHDIIKEVLQKTSVQTAYTIFQRCSAKRWFGLTLQNGTRIAEPLLQVMTQQSLISDESITKALPLPDLTIGSHLNSMIDGSQIKDLDKHCVYHLKGVRGQIAALSHGLVAVTFYFNDIALDMANEHYRNRPCTT